MVSQPVLKCLPISDEIVEVQRLVLWPLSLRQTSNQRPRAVHNEHAAIITVLLLGQAGRPQASAQPSCELCCNGAVGGPPGVVVIGDRPGPLAAINEQQRPMGAAAIRIRSTGITHGQEQEVGRVVSILILDHALECA